MASITAVGIPSLREGKIKIGLNLQTEFTKLKVHEGDQTAEIIIVGDPKAIQKKMLNKNVFVIEYFLRPGISQPKKSLL